MPDWSLFWDNVWQGFCVISYVVLVLGVIAGLFAAIIFGAMFLWDIVIDWWDDLQRAKRDAEFTNAQEELKQWMKDNEEGWYR